jgi:hypothetical protein
MGCTIWSLNLGGGKGFSSSPKCPDQFPPSLLFNGYQVLWLKWLRCEVDCSPPSSAQVNNEWTYNSIPPFMSSWCEQGQFYLYLCTWICKYLKCITEEASSNTHTQTNGDFKGLLLFRFRKASGIKKAVNTKTKFLKLIWPMKSEIQ